MTDTMARWAPQVPWGLCALVAADHLLASGGLPVRGWLRLTDGWVSHWWAVDLDGTTIDPMAADLHVLYRVQYPEDGCLLDDFLRLVQHQRRRESIWQIDRPTILADLAEIHGRYLSGVGEEGVVPCR